MVILRMWFDSLNGCTNVSEILREGLCGSKILALPEALQRDHRTRGLMINGFMRCGIRWRG
jgi:hypothetical protein